MHRIAVVSFAALCMVIFVTACSEDATTDNRIPHGYARVSGQVTTEDGAPLAVAEVYLSYTFPDEIALSNDGLSSVTSDGHAELRAFSGRAYNDSIALQWTAYNEYAVDHYKIFRSGYLVASVPAQHSQFDARYTWTDISVEDTMEYFYVLESVLATGERKVLGRVRSHTLDSDIAPPEFALHGSVPSPVLVQMELWYDLAQASTVLLTIRARDGSFQDTLRQGAHFASRHGLIYRLDWMPNGLFDVRLRAAGRDTTVTILRNASLDDSRANTVTDAYGFYTLDISVGDMIYIDNGWGYESRLVSLATVILTAANLAEIDEHIMTLAEGEEHTVNFVIPGDD